MKNIPLNQYSVPNTKYHSIEVDSIEVILSQRLKVESEVGFLICKANLFPEIGPVKFNRAVRSN